MADKKNQLLFDDFAPVSTEAWMEKIAADLKGADFEKKLVWRTNEGFNVRPFYRSEDLENVSYLDTLPGDVPFVRGNEATPKGWHVRQDILVNDVSKANEKALELLTKGVTSLGFIIDDEELLTPDAIASLLKNINSDAMEVNFSVRHGNKKLMEALVATFQKYNRDLSQVQGSIGFDPIGSFTISGKVCTSMEEMMDYACELLETGKVLSKFRTIAINGRYFNNAGATVVQELGLALSMGNQYLSELTNRNVSIGDATAALKFNFGVGSNYFMEIAKLRAARMLWASIVEQYKPSGTEAQKMHIHSETSEWNKTIFDPYVNMLRTQTEAMSATLGGTQSLTVQPFDFLYKESNNFSERIARNQQLLLKEESHFDKIADPAAGSYYIEQLTDSIAEEAWKLFVEIEEKGGYLAALKEGYVQQMVKESADKRRKAVATRRENLLGTNQFPNFAEQVSANLENLKSYEVNTEGAIIEPIQLFRGADQFEALRLATEKAAKRPKVFMLTYGHLAMRLARSQFSSNFFACAGYEVVDNNGFSTVEEGVEAAVAANADIVVLCSSDDEYVEAAPATLAALNGKAQLVTAGAPACMDELMEKGIEHFIHVRSNVLETLQKFNELLNI
jgi:methylmalonyl-CoA mutase